MGSNEKERNDSKRVDNMIKRFRCWNVRSINGKEEELVAEMKKYQLEVLGLSETKVRGNNVKQIGDVVCVYSGVQEVRAIGEVVILLSMSFGAFLEEWKCINERIVLVRLKVEGVWVSLIQVYAPREDRSQDVS